jgi:peptide/nickel transport system permease protein
MDAIVKSLRKAPPTALFGMLVILFYVFLAIFAPVISPHGETEIVGDQFEPWGDAF